MLGRILIRKSFCVRGGATFDTINTKERSPITEQKKSQCWKKNPLPNWVLLLIKNIAQYLCFFSVFIDLGNSHVILSHLILCVYLTKCLSYCVFCCVFGNRFVEITIKKKKQCMQVSHDVTTYSSNITLYDERMNRKNVTILNSNSLHT